ncbi:MAG: NAD(P)-dependent oxidoreductase [Pseudomonadota bacterium]
MKFTVLGGAGFIGRHLVQALRLAGHDVFSPLRDDVTVFEQNLGHVLYCIGLTADFRTRPFDTMQAHVSILAEVLQRASFESLVYLSSTRVYGRSATGAEDAPLTVQVSDPQDLYNISKLAGESLCMSCGRAGVKIARLSNVIGEDAGSGNFLSSLIGAALDGHIALQSDPASAKDYVLLDDVVGLLPRIALAGKASIYNVASGINITHSAIIERLITQTGCSVSFVQDAPLTLFPMIDNGRIAAEFDFCAAPLLDQLPRLIDQFRHKLAPSFQDKQP